MRKTIKHKVYTFEEKKQIVLLYLDHHMGTHEIVRKYDLSDNNVYVFTCLDTVKVLLNVLEEITMKVSVINEE